MVSKWLPWRWQGTINWGSISGWVIEDAGGHHRVEISHTAPVQKSGETTVDLIWWTRHTRLTGWLAPTVAETRAILSGAELKPMDHAEQSRLIDQFFETSEMKFAMRALPLDAQARVMAAHGEIVVVKHRTLWIGYASNMLTVVFVAAIILRITRLATGSTTRA